jgi:hypothetical protein
MQQPAAGTVRYVLNGLLQGLLTQPHWTYSGHIGPLVVYRDTRARGRAWLESPGAAAASAASITGTTSVPTVASWQDPVTIVEAPESALLVRSEQYSPGWSVTLQEIGAGGALGPPSSRTVQAVGLLQGVEIPAGHYRVTWHYHSERVDIGLVLGAFGVIVSGGFLVVGLNSRRRRPRRPDQSAPTVPRL